MRFLFLKSLLFIILYARLSDSENYPEVTLIKISSLVKISHLFEGKKYNVLNSVKVNLDCIIFFLKFKKS